MEDGWTCVGTSDSVCSTNCNDGLITGSEECDDMNINDGDGCTDCLIDLEYKCEGEPSVCFLSCGDGMVDESEECDNDSSECIECLIVELNKDEEEAKS